MASPRSELSTPSPRGLSPQSRPSVSHMSSSVKTTARILFCSRGASPSHRRRGCDCCCCCCCCCCFCDSMHSDCKEPPMWSTTVKESPNRLGSNWGRAGLGEVSNGLGILTPLSPAAITPPPCCRPRLAVSLRNQLGCRGVHVMHPHAAAITATRTARGRYMAVKDTPYPRAKNEESPARRTKWIGTDCAGWS